MMVLRLALLLFSIATMIPTSSAFRPQKQQTRLHLNFGFYAPIQGHHHRTLDPSPANV